jgi:hypothetical protein
MEDQLKGHPNTSQQALAGFLEKENNAKYRDPRSAER